MNQPTALEVPNRLYERNPVLALEIKNKLQEINEHEGEPKKMIEEFELLLAAAMDEVWPYMECGTIILVDNDTAKVLTHFSALLANDEDPPAFIIGPIGPDDPRGFCSLLFV